MTKQVFVMNSSLKNTLQAILFLSSEKILKDISLAYLSIF